MLYIGNKKVNIYIGDKKVKRAYIGDLLYYSSGNPVTYYVDAGTIYTEEVEDGATCLSPTTFTPSKSGYTFTGWREDSTASSSILESKVMGDSPITLYAVFQKNITVTKYNGSTSATTETKQQYYNNTNIANPTFILSQTAQSGWTANGWTTSTSATGSIAVNNGGSVTLTADTTYYGRYSQTITCYKYNGSASVTSSTGTRYWNSSGNYSNPSFTLSQNAVSGWTVRGWATSTGATAGVAVSNGGTVTLSANATYYGMYYQTITLSYSGNGNTGGSTAAQTGTRYWNSAGNYSNPSFSLRSCGFTRTNYSFVNWRMGSTSGTAYNAGASVTLNANTVFYATWQMVTSRGTMAYCGDTFYYPQGSGVGHLAGTDTSWGGSYNIRGSISGGIISWYGSSGLIVKANVACNITITFTAEWRAVPTNDSYEVRLYSCKNSTLGTSLYWRGGIGNNKADWSDKASCTASGTLAAGDTFSIREFGGSGSDGNGIDVILENVTITATPIL